MVFSFILFFLSLFSPDWSYARVAIENRNGHSIDIQKLDFWNEKGQRVFLGQYFEQKKPVILAMVYYGCPGACTVLLDQLVEGLKKLSFFPSRAFEVIVVSIDSTETPGLAWKKKQIYLKKYGYPETERGWHFLVGEEASIIKLSNQIGFFYERNRETGVFSHPSVLFVLTSHAVLSSTLEGTQLNKKLLRVALLTAAGGQVGNFLDRLRSICYAYLPHKGWLDRPERWFLVGILVFIVGIGVGLRRKVLRFSAAKCSEILHKNFII